MATKPRQISHEPPGDFQSRFIVLAKTKQFAGGRYELIGAGKDDNGWYDILKAQSEATMQANHTAVMAAVSGYWNTQEVPA